MKGVLAAASNSSSKIIFQFTKSTTPFKAMPLFVVIFWLLGNNNCNEARLLILEKLSFPYIIVM
jgi:hypothetical protein